MTNLDTVLKRRGITLLIKVHRVKAMVFPVAVYGCESWATKKGWVSKNWCFQTVVLEKTLESLLDSQEIKPVDPKGNQPWIFMDWCWSWSSNPWPPGAKSHSLEKTLMLGKIEGKRRGQQRIRWLNDLSDSMDLSLSKLREIVKDREALCAAVHEVTKSQTRLSNCRTTTSTHG